MFLLLGQLVSTRAHALPSDSEQPIHIKADAGEMDQKAGTLFYSGEVRLDRGSLQVHADSMTIEIDDNDKLTQLTAHGQPNGKQAHFQQTVEINKPDVFADADIIIYFAEKEKIELRGNAHLIQNNNELRGELIIYDVTAGKVNASAQPGGKIDIIFQPSALKLK